ncbi:MULTISPECIES: restriction endonuclease [Aequorivita]|uniref:Restriction endonuclease n=1 Tax=Aequorivita iocasae TaxID=2803865 RepID=A0ABX7DRM8_9FLAO|nr:MULTISPECIES: restriction endonuclease [Aequorivita]QQX76452.1 restriction endonuclease [Aequorivita iocasae]UCA55924.1 restriction endonuclease [Aequorivita sp. F7]
MLTPTDTHLLAGILTKLSNPDSVEIILGKMVLDIAAQRKRDIDISVKYINEDGEEVSFVGLQVKDHTRKLGSPEVEQLCIHFKDSPSIKKGGIISASGFTKPAISKAAYHGIDLYHLRVWEKNQGIDLEHIKFGDDFFTSEIVPTIINKPFFTLIFERELTSKESQTISNESPLFIENSSNIDDPINIKTLCHNLLNSIMKDDSIQAKFDEVGFEKEISINQRIHISNNIFIKLGEEFVKINGANVEFKLIQKLKKMETNFKILININNPEERIGALVSEMSNGLLIGMVTSTDDKSVKLITIPISDRNKEKIHEMKIK